MSKTNPIPVIHSRILNPPYFLPIIVIAVLLLIGCSSTMPPTSPPTDTPPPPPKIPSFIQAIPSDNEITLIWGNPSDTNALSNFTLMWSNGSATGETNVSRSLTNASHSYTITGTGADHSTALVVDTEYTLSVKANYPDNMNNTSVAVTNATTTAPDFKVLYDVSDNMFVSNTEHIGIQQGSRAITDTNWTTSWTIGGTTYTNHHTASLNINGGTAYLTYSNLPNRVQFNANFVDVTNGLSGLLTWSLLQTDGSIFNGDSPPLDGLMGGVVERFGTSLSNLADRITSPDTRSGPPDSSITIWLDPDYSPAETGQPTSGYTAPTNLSLQVYLYYANRLDIGIKGTLAIYNPSFISAIPTGNINDLFSHTDATPYIEVGSGKTVPAPDQRGAYRLTLRFEGGVERTVYVKVRE